MPGNVREIAPSIVMPPLVSIIGRLEHLADQFFSARPISTAHLGTTMDGILPGISPCQQGSTTADPGSMLAAIQSLAHRFLQSREWITSCVVPGLPVLHHPAAASLAFSGQCSSEALAAQWRIVVLQGDGARPGRATLKVCAPCEDPFTWRACTVAQARVWHHPVADPNQRVGSLQQLHKAQQALTDGDTRTACDYLANERRMLEQDSAAEAMFEAVWDLLYRVCSEPKPSVSPGMWYWPESGPREVRTRAAITEDALHLLICPATFDISLMKLHGLELLDSRSGGLPDVNIGRAIDRIALAHALWLDEAAARLVALLTDGGICPNTSKARSRLEGVLLGQHRGGIPGGIAERTCTWLSAHGHYDWAVAVERECSQRACSRGLENRASFLTGAACGVMVGLAISLLTSRRHQ